ncbi:MAG: dihydroorotase [Candidatus Hodarchaeales archaeon]|jgi:allantoinase
MVDLNVVNGKIFIETGLIEADLSIDRGKILAMGKSNTLPEASETIDASGKIVLPGGIDVHAHMLDLIFVDREDFYTGTQAAASGGITTVLEMPMGIEGRSVAEVFDMQLDAMNKKCIVDFGIIGAAGHATIESIAELAKKGAIAYKTFMIEASEELTELKDLASKDEYHLIKIFSEISKTGLVSSVHAENGSIIANEMEKIVSAGGMDFQAHTDSRPAIAEEEACLKAMLLARHANTKLNLVHMSSKGAFELIRDAKKKGWDVSCEITPHHLFLTSDDGEKIGPWAKVDPPLRSKEHVIAAWKALNDGTIDIIASDHSPYEHHEKDLDLKNGNFFDIASGMTGIETIIPLMLDAVNKNMTSLKRLVEITATVPAKRFGLYPRKGTISINSDADFFIVNMKKEYELKNENLFTKPKMTVFDGLNLRGRVDSTIVRGKVIFDQGEFCTKKGYGKLLIPKKS